MNDRYLFRGKYQAIKDKWIVGSLIQFRFDFCPSLDFCGLWRSGDASYLNIDDASSVGQCTGLHDKHGVLIFEGDIVKFRQQVYEIYFTQGSFALYDKEGLMIGKIGGHNDHVYSLMNLYIDCDWEENCAFDIEIIGNIYDKEDSKC